MGDVAMYMENIDEYINDENKVVTYKWLSIQLSIPCNTAKRLLYHYVSTQGKDEAKEPLHVTYLVIGSVSLKDGVEHTKVVVVPHSKLEAAKQSLSSVSCVHVYSVSKSCIKDPASTLYATDYDCVRQNLAAASEFGGIECPEAKARSDADIASLRKDATYRPSTPQDTRKAPDPRLVKPAEGVKQGGAKPATDGDGKKAKTSTAVDKGKASAKGALANMFAAQKTAVKKELKENGASEEKVKEEPNNNKASAAGKKSSADKKAGRISGFFTKGANPREDEIKQENEESTTLRRSPRKSDAVKTEDLDSDLDEKSDVEPLVTKKESPVKKSPKKESPRKRTSTKRTKGRPTTQPNRSRIMFMDSDSSAGEEDEHSGSESPAPPSPPAPALDVPSSDEDETPEPLPSSPPTASTGRGKKRKLVETTFADEDGFLVTKKEYMDVTDSESEEPEPPASKKKDRGKTPPLKQEQGSPSPKASPTKKTDGKPTKRAPAKKSKQSPAKGKQASIMSFFKKK